MNGFLVDINDLKSGKLALIAVDTEGTLNTADFSADVRLKGEACSESGLSVFSGQVTGTVCVPCARCLTPAVLPYDESIEFSFAFSEEAAAENDEVFLVHGGKLDFAEVLSGMIRADIPISVLCADNCKGLCPVCGSNLNEEQCGCAIELINPVLKAADIIKLKN